MYNKDQEYTLKYIVKNGEEKELKYTPASVLESCALWFKGIFN